MKSLLVSMISTDVTGSLGIILPVILGMFTKRKSRLLNNLVFITMAISTLAKVVYMSIDHSEIIQPGVFGIAIS